LEKGLRVIRRGEMDGFENIPRWVQNDNQSFKKYTEEGDDLNEGFNNFENILMNCKLIDKY
jgi:hypothetical protein